MNIVFQQDNAPVHKLKIIGNLFQENEWKVLEGTGRSRSVSYWKFMGVFEATIAETGSFQENLEEKLHEIRNEIEADVERNLYENYTNRLLDVKKAKGLVTRY